MKIFSVHQWPQIDDVLYFFDPFFSHIRSATSFWNNPQKKGIKFLFSINLKIICDEILYGKFPMIAVCLFFKIDLISNFKKSAKIILSERWLNFFFKNSTDSSSISIKKILKYQKNVNYIENENHLYDLLINHSLQDSIILFMGAGSITRIAHKFIQKNDWKNKKTWIKT